MIVFTLVWRNLDRYKTRFVLVTIAGVINGIVGFLIPLTLAEFTKNDLSGSNVKWLIALVAGLYVGSLLFSYVLRASGESLASQFANHLRIKYFSQLTALTPPALQRVHSGYLLSLMNRVSDGITDILRIFFWTVAPGGIVAILFLAYIAQQSIGLALLNVMLMVLFFIISVLLSRRMVPLTVELNARRASLLESYADFMANLITVKKLGVRTYAESRLDRRSTDSNTQIQKVATFHARRWFLLHGLFGVTFMTTVGFVIHQIGNGSLSPTVLIVFISAYGMLRSLIEQLSENVMTLMEMKACVTQLQEVARSEERIGSHRIRDGWQHISFTDVRFHHETGPVISIPAFSLRAADKVAVIGKSGQGKSTFVDLFINSLTSATGIRQVDDAPYDTVNNSFFEQQIAVVAQDTDLFNTSIRENLTLGASYGDERLYELLQELDLRSWVENLADGLDTVVGEKGTRLSAGQKQRLCILRAILLDRSLYVLDEPTSHLDAKTEEVIVHFLEHHLHDKAVLAVTHRPALQRLCGETYEMRNHTLQRVPPS
jgi:ABC-type bacteriocin/lantibiotic exporter with double-glycine peptidase domain